MAGGIIATSNPLKGTVDSFVGALTPLLSNYGGRSATLQSGGLHKAQGPVAAD